MNIDYDLLTQQRDFMLNYFWHDNPLPEHVEGIVSLLDYLLDKNEASPNE